MVVDYLADIREFHRINVEPYLGKPNGATQTEIQGLETTIGYELPLAYRQFLQWMGNDHFGIFQGSDWFMRNVLDNTGYLSDLLAENGVEYDLPEHYLAFFGHQGYMSAWFELPKTDDNPIVWFFHEGEIESSPRQEGRFTDFVLKDMQSFASCLPSTAPLHLAVRESAQTGKPVRVGNVTFVALEPKSESPATTAKSTDISRAKPRRRSILRRLLFWLR